MPKGIPNDQSSTHSLLHRLKIAQGHLNRVIRMVEKGTYCIDVINQSHAVQAALRSADQAILKNHLQTCVADSLGTGRKKDVIDEVLKVVDKS